MQNKTTQILALLSPEEMKSLDKWLSSPWCNTNKKLLQVFTILKKHHPAFEHSSLTKPKLFRKLYPGKAFDDKSMRNLLSSLTKEVEHFLQHEQLSKNPQLGKRLLAEEYQKRNEVAMFDKQALELIKELAVKPNKNLEDLGDLNFLFEKIYREPSSIDRQNPGNDTLEQADFWLDQFYALAKARNLVEFSERQKILAEQHDLDFIADYLSKLLSGREGRSNVAGIDFYLQFYKTKESEQESGIKKLIASYSQKVDRMAEKDQTICLMLLINQAIRFYSKGNFIMANEALKLYKFGLAKDLLLIDGRLTESTFTNIVSLAINEKEYTFAKEFIENMHSALPEFLQEDAKVWGNASLMYHANGKIEKQLELILSQRKRDLTTFFLRSKNLLLNNYFDYYRVNIHEDHSFLLDYTYAFEKQIRRNVDLSQKILESVKKSVQYKRKLFLLFQDVNRKTENVDHFYTEIIEEPSVFDRRWILQKIKEIRPQQ